MDKKELELMVQQLAPCPFCGRDVELVRACNKNALPDAPDVFYIVCPNCGFLTHMEQSKEQAIENCNDGKDCALSKIYKVLPKKCNKQNTHIRRCKYGRRTETMPVLRE